MDWAEKRINAIAQKRFNLIMILLGIIILLIMFVIEPVFSNIYLNSLFTAVGTTFIASGLYMLFVDWMSSDEKRRINVIFRSGLYNIYSSRHTIAPDLEQMFYKATDSIRILCITLLHFRMDNKKAVIDALERKVKISILLPDYEDKKMKSVLLIFQKMFNQGDIIEQVAQTEEWIKKLIVDYDSLVEYRKYREIPQVHLVIGNNTAFASPYRPYMSPAYYTASFAYKKSEKSENMYRYYVKYYDEIYERSNYTLDCDNLQLDSSTIVNSNAELNLTGQL